MASQVKPLSKHFREKIAEIRIEIWYSDIVHAIVLEFLNSRLGYFLVANMRLC